MNMPPAMVMIVRSVKTPTGRGNVARSPPVSSLKDRAKFPSESKTEARALPQSQVSSESPVSRCRLLRFLNSPGPPPSRPLDRK